MSTYLMFFGKSQDFTARVYDKNKPIEDFNSVIKDFDLLESKIFTVDDIKNKEILSRYSFTTQGKSFCLLKLYSFAQAFSGNRIAGSIYGVALLSDKLIDLTKDNLALLRAAKDNFAKLSLDGAKFNKSNFKEDANRIWTAIITNNKGNLLDLIDTSPLKINNTAGQVAFFVKNLFDEATKLNPRISNQDVVYFSEDLEHLKRTQNKWGKANFPIYWEQHNQYVVYKEPEIIQAQESASLNIESKKLPLNTDVGNLKAELEHQKYLNKNLFEDLEQVKAKEKILFKIIFSLIGFNLLLLLYIVFFSSKQSADKNSSSAGEIPYVDTINTDDSYSVFLADSQSVEDGFAFLKECKFIYSFNVKKSFADSLQFKNAFQKIQMQAIKSKLNIKNIETEFKLKMEKINEIRISKEEKTLPTKSTKGTDRKKNKSK